MSRPELPIELAWGLLAAMSLLWIWLGRFWGRRARELDGFMVAGRNVGMALGAATAVATWITSNTTMLAPQLTLEFGVWGMLAYSTASLGLVAFAPLAARIRRLMPHGHTAAEFIHRRYGRACWVVFMAISLLYALAWLVSMGMAGGLLLETLSGIPYVQGMTLILGVCAVYTLVGGLYAVIGTDFIQSLVVLVGIVVVVVAVTQQVPIAEVHESVAAKRPALLQVFFPAALIAVFNNLLFGMGEVFHSNVWWSRALAMRPGVGGRAFALAGAIWLPVPIIAGFLGLAAVALGLPISRPDMVGPQVASAVLGSVGAVLVFLVVFASIASSIDSLLAATSDLVTKELVHRFWRRDADDAQLRKIAARSVVGAALLAWLLCLPKLGTLASVLFLAGPLVASTIWPIIAGLYWPRATASTALVAMIAGSSVGLWVYFGVGWFAASLASAVVSALVTAFGLSRSRRHAPFDFSTLASAEQHAT